MKISTVVAFPATSSLSPPPSLCFCSSSRSYHSILYSSFPFVFLSLSLSPSNQKGVLKRVEPSSSPPTLRSLFDLVYEMTTAIAIEDVCREVKILKALSRHKNLVRFYDAFEDANVYIVMELCKGGELLDKILSRGGRYTEEDAKVIVVQILSVIAYCHLQDVVHCDLKPENFLFATREEDASVRVIDFGLSDFIRPENMRRSVHPWLKNFATLLIGSLIDNTCFKERVGNHIAKMILTRCALKWLIIYRVWCKTFGFHDFEQG